MSSTQCWTRTNQPWGIPALRVRLLVNGEGAVAVSEVVQSTGHTAMEAFALELAGALSFTPGMKDDVATSTEMEFSVAMRVRD